MSYEQLELYSWVRVPSAFTDVPHDKCLITRDGHLVARIELNIRLPFHSEIVSELCAVLQDIEDNVDDPGYPLLDGRPVEVSP